MDTTAHADQQEHQPSFTGPTTEASRRDAGEGSRQGFESLISAACYLSLGASGALEPVLEAVQILYDLAQEMRGEGLALGPDPEMVEDAIWQTKQIKWERHNSIETSVAFIKATRSAAPARDKRPRRAGWWSVWRGLPRVQPF